MKKFALLSVTDKTNIVSFAKDLLELGYEILSTGGTARHLTEHGIKYTSVSDYTGQEEIMDGRVKTLHPKIHGGILARRAFTQDTLELEELCAGFIEVVAVNLYPFSKVLIDSQARTEDEMIEYIDIGGPTLLRAAAKNFKDVYSIIDPNDYKSVVSVIKSKENKLDFRKSLAAKVFAHISAYDLKIAGYLSRDHHDVNQENSLPQYLGSVNERIQGLRYGENPTQLAGWYAPIDRGGLPLSSLHQLQGKELSYNNVNDIYAATELMLDLKSEFKNSELVVIIKHANPCGVAVDDTMLGAFNSALSCDPVSAFGGIIAFNNELSEEVANQLVKSFYEVIIAQNFSDAALAILSQKKNLRVITADYNNMSLNRIHQLHIKTVIEGVLVQGHDIGLPDFSKLTWAVGDRFLSSDQEADAMLAAIVCKHVKSNAIVIAKNKLAIGIGAGQMNRVDSSRIAINRAKNHGHDVEGSVVASDAFLPFSDNVEVFSEAGIVLIVQPGGSIRDQEVIDVARNRGINMVFTGSRHFRH